MSPLDLRVIDPILTTSTITRQEWFELMQRQNPKLRLIEHVEKPEVYHVDPIENAEFLTYGKPFSTKTMDYIKDAMNVLFIWETFD
jgi:hypothetical protein